MAKKKTRVQEPRGPGPKGSIPRVAEPKKKPWAMSIERAQVKPLSELPLGPVKKRVKLLKEASPEALAKLKRRRPKPLSELLPSRVVKKSAKPAPGRSPMLKWHKKSR